MVVVSAAPGGTWRTDWDIGMIDRDPRLSDDWFCQEKYDGQFMALLQSVAGKSDLPGFEIPCATVRVGSGKGMRRELALDLAGRVVALWQAVLIDWEVQGRPARRRRRRDA
jgi:hypothetical protein